MFDVSTIRQTETIEFYVRARDPVLALALANGIVAELNRFIIDANSTVAAGERKFLSSREREQFERLAEVEASLSRFLMSNRQYRDSPELTFEQDRLQRQVALQQQLYLSLAQANEEASAREVRDVPTLIVVNPALFPIFPDSKQLPLFFVLGAMIGSILAAALTMIRAFTESRMRAGDVSLARFMAAARAALLRR